MKTVIEIKTMRFYAFHGVLSQERTVGNMFTVGVAYMADGIEKAIWTDRLEDTISYSDVYQTVKNEMSIPSQLLEHLAGRLVHALKKRFPALVYIKLKVSKHAPPLGGEAHSASVTLEETWS